MNKETIARSITNLWDPLSDEQRELFIKNLVVRKTMRDEILFAEGDEPDTLFYLLRGKVAMLQQGLGGQTQIVRMVEPGAMFGYAVAFEGKMHSTMAVAGSDTVIATLPMRLVFHLTWENGNFAMLFIKDLSSLLNLSVRRTMNLTQKHIRGRLAETILFMKAKYGTEEDGQTLAVNLSREELGKLSNMTTSNAIRTLSAFASEGIVRVEGRRIMLIHEDELQTISDLG